MNSACVILAAGRGSRLGGRNKALLQTHGQSFLERIASSCRACGVNEFVVIAASPHKEETAREAERLGLVWLENLEPERGMASSVTEGFAHASRAFESSHAWLWPVDTPGVEIATLQNLTRRAREAAVVIPTYAGRGGHPALIAREIWTELAACVFAPEGARSVFRSDPSRVLRVPVLDALVCVDVDVPRDLERLA